MVVLRNDLDLLVEHLPQLDGLVWSLSVLARNKQWGIGPSGRALTIGTEEEVRRILPLAPSDAVDLFLDLKRLEVVKLGLV